MNSVIVGWSWSLRFPRYLPQFLLCQDWWSEVVRYCLRLILHGETHASDEMGNWWIFCKYLSKKLVDYCWLIIEFFSQHDPGALSVKSCFFLIYYSNWVKYVWVKCVCFDVDWTGFMDCATECWKHPLFIGESSWLQLYSWPQVLRGKEFSLFCYNL